MGLGVLFATDIDNTCMVLDQELGAEPWLNDLMSHILPFDVPETKDFYEKRRGQLLAVWEAIVNVSGMHPAEKAIAQNILALQHKNVRTIGLTGRKQGSLEGTLRGFDQAGIDFSRTSPGQDLMNFKSDRGARPISYRKGVFMLDGQDKGKMLATLFKLMAYRPDVVVFVDNAGSNIDAVDSALSGMGIGFYGYRYAGTDGLEDAYRRSEKAAARVEMKYFKEKGALLSDREAEEIAKKTPVSDEEVNVLIYGTPSLNLRP